MTLSIPRLTIEPQIRAAAENRPALSIGSRGEGVCILQQALIDLGYEMPRSTQNGRSLPDCIFGIETDQVVKRFQRDNALKGDGAAGRLTFEKLEEALIIDDKRRAARMRAEMFVSVPVG
jgi:peptidoglycan hydrolase-like protein with peptidoglycan-binding domain